VGLNETTPERPVEPKVSASSEESRAGILTLDDQATRDAAAADPTGFVAGLVTPVVIDEVQRAPDLAPKAYVNDSGLLCHLIGADAERLAQDGTIAGPVFETFVAMELRRQLAWQDNAPRQFHYRDRDDREVDLVLERRDGSIIAVEVKTAASASSSDFAVSGICGTSWETASTG
jgi:hypothetical protein